MDIDITVKDVNRGNARCRYKGYYRITIPQWAIDRSEEYGIYYICHELAHCTCSELFGTMGHCTEFKVIEDVYLADFGITIKRKKAYPKTLVAFGQEVYRN